MKTRTRASLLGALAMLLILVSGQDSHAADASPPGRSHDGGFFLRLAGGAGSSASEFEIPTQTAKLSGTALDFSIAGGVILKPNLALHGTFFGWVSDADFELSGSDEITTVNTDMTALGAGLTYYLMPVNVFISGSAGIGHLSAEGSQGLGETDKGFAAEICLGKEWWGADHWSVGIAGSFSYHSLPEQDEEERWTGGSYALRISVTMN